MSEAPKTETEYYARKDSFLRYVTEFVNPARVEAGLNPIGHAEADTCFQIIHDFENRLEESRRIRRL